MTTALVRIERIIVIALLVAALVALAMVSSSRGEAREMAPSAFQTAEYPV